MRTMSRRWLPLVGVVALLAAVAAFLPGGAAAAVPTTQTYFICPSVGQNNPNGMWVVGYHGGYYVNIPHQGATGSKVFLTVPVKVFSVAQIPAGWGLYSSLPNYPNFVGMAGILQEGIDHWLSPWGDTSGFSEGDMVMVMDNGDGTYTVHDATTGADVTIGAPIPLASGAIW
jgi:hypothetical protein